MSKANNHPLPTRHITGHYSVSHCTHLLHYMVAYASTDKSFVAEHYTHNVRDKVLLWAPTITVRGQRGQPLERWTMMVVKGENKGEQKLALGASVVAIGHLLLLEMDHE